MLTEQQARAFLAVDTGGCLGNGDGNGDGDGNGYGNGDGNGCGDGSGNGCGDGSGYGSGYGGGYGNGSGYGGGYGNGDGNGCGYGDGNGNGYGGGSGSGGVKEFEGHKLYDIDDMPTALTSVHGNVAKGFLLEGNVFKKPCYVVKDGNRFAHGATLREAFTSLQEKLYDGSTEEERLDAFKAKFPEFDTPYPNRDLFAYHHVLTGSCRMGREQFVSSHGISLDGETTVREFVRLTAGSYGGNIVRQLPQLYGEALAVME